MTELPKPLADTEPQATYDMLERIGNNGWASTGQTDIMCPKHLQTLADHGVSINETVEEMRRRGFSDGELKQLRRWENKRVFGVFDPKPHHRRRI